ncbi:MAG: ACP S-malonyltransferase [Gammaproteobacteria bacterium]|nr:ACP S-malonyltransferase [Gammaproteobacteria bacterium]NND38745.1 ACP S-malonyltransferase [Pseudomonadales bacterium]MBT8151270.1 ACP S-malonyltransferase [Gammaproteobacteria bacterium]NNL11135.1 ACP S-malonyltransferase [Pseudomonadales bacterium]NNM12209.1 ACP S-malonyltransferase [Pseudomonadales bacterium]
MVNNVSLAFFFPGQGSQSVGMLSALAEAFPQLKKTFADASAVLGYDLWALAQQGPQETLNLTERTQPLLLTSSVAMWRLWRELGGPLPAMMAGHSLGEYSALVCSEVLGFEDAVDLVRKRGQYMQTAVPVGAGAMAAVLGLDDDVIVAACAAACTGSEVVEAVNFNSPGQVVIAGSAAAVDRASAALSDAGAKRVAKLPVSAPFHTSLMRPAAESLALDIDALAFSAPRVPIVHNVNAQPETNPTRIKALMIEQTASPVQWTRSVQFMVQQGIEKGYECGPGKVLAGLVRRVQRSLVVTPLDDADKFEALVQQA